LLAKEARPVPTRIKLRNFHQLETVSAIFVILMIGEKVTVW